MKKITFILLAFIGTTAFAQEGVTATNQASADIVSPITISESTDLVFGKVANNAAGNVIVGTDNSVSGTATRVGGTTPTAAEFTVNAALGYGYTVTLPTDNEITLTNQTTTGSSMLVNNIVHNSDKVGDGADETFQVGGTLTLAADQVVGNYTGSLPITVAYE
ncbi:DUF4402 domain-containing protein [Zunongwangia sp. F260]|uniref:DUF4402 domain-containing protein n=1 Tax=Autumnicola lenta TaxID=3075593 RepID=A0ABU3CP95_9FLAO|nr:DUF4402 domain-containing protein [Zunongwangia sp. F260]MDT0648174.1 DUF4402 domain-containing protein [Zunongwangia sp. F260]